MITFFFQILMIAEGLQFVDFDSCAISGLLNSNSFGDFKFLALICSLEAKGSDRGGRRTLNSHLKGSVFFTNFGTGP